MSHILIATCGLLQGQPAREVASMGPRGAGLTTDQTPSQPDCARPPIGLHAAATGDRPLSPVQVVGIPPVPGRESPGQQAHVDSASVKPSQAHAQTKPKHSPIMRMLMWFLCC